MVTATELSNHVRAGEFLKETIRASTSDAVESLLKGLPIRPEDEYAFNPDWPESGWKQGCFHWVPVGRDRGNAGRIKLANQPVNPIAERLINGMEALIELRYQLEEKMRPGSSPPGSPREAVRRYFGLPPLDSLPKLDASDESRRMRETARNLARSLRARLLWDKVRREFSVTIEDDGVGQAPSAIHRTLLSLGSTTKADKTYLIGVFGQGGSSAYAVSRYSWLVSRRASGLHGSHEDGAGWTVIRHFFPKGRRDDYFAYLAAHPDGRVPHFSARDADEAGVKNGTRFAHIGYDFGKGGSAITRQLFQSLNHVLYNPILPFELYVGDTLAVVYGNAYRLSNLGRTKSSSPAALDKLFPPQVVGVSEKQP